VSRGRWKNWRCLAKEDLCNNAIGSRGEDTAALTFHVAAQICTRLKRVFAECRSRLHIDAAAVFVFSCQLGCLSSSSSLKILLEQNVQMQPDQHQTAELVSREESHQFFLIHLLLWATVQSDQKLISLCFFVLINTHTHIHIYSTLPVNRFILCLILQVQRTVSSNGD